MARDSSFYVAKKSIGSTRSSFGEGQRQSKKNFATRGLKQNLVVHPASLDPKDVHAVARYVRFEAVSGDQAYAAAEVRVEEVEGNPGYYTSKFWLRPHYQLEGLTVSLRLVADLPAAAK